MAVRNRQFDNLVIGNEKKSVLAEYEKLKIKIFPDLRIAYLHGRMKAKEKDEVMGKFSGGEIDIMVATSVVEVGVNIPNASVMMIEGAERFGLAQLHQFRGRVGRSTYQSYCFLFTDSDSQPVAERLAYFEKNTDGFALAEYDLQFRGPGELSGMKQWGISDVGMEALKNIKLVEAARAEAAQLVARDPELTKHPLLAERSLAVLHEVHLE